GASVVTGQQSFPLSDEATWEPAEVIAFSTPDGQLAMARRALAAGDSRRAEHLAGRWIDHHGRHPRLPDAYLIRGDALRQQSSYYDALFDYEYIARVFTGSEVFVTALERELEALRQSGGGGK
ncbi:MAG: tetratricopeptide repeat protein, partial [Nitrospinae bacterium]|nr:tetratricopeptide repeat protein [Nitrospinota bacterium]